MNDIKTVKPWYREAWLWFVLAPLIVVIFVCAIFITIAVKYGDDVVRDDYYEAGKMINHRFAEEAAAKEQGIEAQLTLNVPAKRIELGLNQPISSETVIRLELSHPVNSDYDVDFDMQRKSAQAYYADLSKIPAGRWYLRIESVSASDNTIDWRLSGEIDFSKTTTVSVK